MNLNNISNIGEVLIASKKSVLVLLAAYNGEQYIAEQLNSILAQKGVKLSIIISVDKSTDATLMIAQEYQSKYP